MIVHVSFYDMTRDGVHSEGTSIGMGDIYRLGDAVMAATNIKVSPTPLDSNPITPQIEHLRYSRCWWLLLHVRRCESNRVPFVLETI